MTAIVSALRWCMLWLNPFTASQLVDTARYCVTDATSRYSEMLDVVIMAAQTGATAQVLDRCSSARAAVAPTVADAWGCVRRCAGIIWPPGWFDGAGASGLEQARHG